MNDTQSVIMWCLTTASWWSSWASLISATRTGGRSSGNGRRANAVRSSRAARTRSSGGTSVTSNRSSRSAKSAPIRCRATPSRVSNVVRSASCLPPTNRSASSSASARSGPRIRSPVVT